MDATLIDTIVFAAIAPILGVILFWFIQLLFIESQKLLLNKIKKKHEPFCRLTNLIGIFFQTICHALGYTVTRSGISQFKISIHYGTVSPKKKKEGIFEWISNSFLFIGPFFIPAFLLLILSLLLIYSDIPISQTSPQYFTFGQQLIGFGENLYNYGLQLLTLLATLDLFHPVQLGFLFIFIFLGLGIRPSYIIKQKTLKIDMIYDLKNIKDHILERPLYLLILLIGSYLFFYLNAVLDLNWYTLIFSLFGWISIIAICSLLVAHLIILLIYFTDRVQQKWRLIPFLVLPISYILSRVILFFIPSPFTNSIALLSMCVTTTIITALLHNKRTNKFKTSAKMKPMRVEDGLRRIIEQ